MNPDIRSRAASMPVMSFVFLVLLMLVMPAGAAMPDSKVWGDQLMVLRDNKVHRYDTVAGSWLAPVTLHANASSFDIDSDGAVVAFGTAISKYDPAFGNRVLLGSASSDISAVFLDGNLVIAVHSSGLYGRVTVFNRDTGVQLSTVNTYVDSLYGASHAPGANLITGSRIGVTPDDVVIASYTDAGVVSRINDSQYHGSFPSSSTTWVFGDETRMVDDSGTVYSLPGLTLAGAVANGWIDVAFYGESMVGLRSGELVGYDRSLRELGRVNVSNTSSSRVFLMGDKIYLMTNPGVSSAVQVIPVASLSLPEPGTPVDPSGLAYEVDDAYMDRDGNVLVFSANQSSLFRWSPSERRYTGSFPLKGVPAYMAYSPDTHSAYFSYESQDIEVMDLDAAEPTEDFFHRLPQAPIGMVAAGNLLVVADRTGPWNTHRVISATGEQLASKEWNRPLFNNAWDPVQRKLYFYRDGTSPNDLHYEVIGADGSFGATGETPYHGGFACTPPIRVSPDGSRVVIGSGVVFETSEMTTVANLSNNINDAVWSGGRLVTIREIGGLTQVQTWDGAQFLQGGAVRQLNGDPVRVMDTAEGLLVITTVVGEPRFVLLDDQLEVLYMSPSTPVAPTGLVSTGRTVDSVSFGWQDESDNEEQFRVEYAFAGSNAWVSGVVVPAGVTEATVSGLARDTHYDFRVVAELGDLHSEPSEVVTVRTLSSVDEPAGEPYFLTLTRLFSRSVTLEWQDNASNETGFRILRGASPDGPFTTFHVPAGSEEFTDTSVANATTYYYRVQVVNGGITGDLSEAVAVRTPWSDSGPGYYGRLSVVEVGAYSVEFAWSDTILNEDGYIIERALYGSTDWVRLVTTGHNVEGFTDHTVEPDTRYTYRLAAYNQWGTSSFRNLIVQTPSLGGQYLGHSHRSGDVYYFAFSGPNRIERYDMAARRWLSPVATSVPATALWVDEAGIFVAERREVVRYALDGSGRTQLASAAAEVKMLFTMGRVLVFSPGSRDFSSMDKTTGVFLSTFGYSWSGTGISVNPVNQRAYFRSNSVSPSDINYLTLSQDGVYLGGNDSPHHGAYASATRTYVLPGGQLVADNAGTVYAADTLRFSRSLGEPFIDADFSSSSPVLLRDDMLVSLSSDRLLETARHGFDGSTAVRVAVNATDALVFSKDGKVDNGLRLDVVPLSSMVPREPGPEVSPQGMAYEVDDAFIDRDGDILLFSSGQASLFRWSPSARAYTGSFPLFGQATHAAYSAANHEAYFGYGDHLVTSMPMGSGDPGEQPFANLSGGSLGLESAGDLLVAADQSGAWGSHLVFSSSGDLLHSREWNQPLNQKVWDPVKRRLYYPRSGNTIEYEQIAVNGVIEQTGQAPFNSGGSPAAPVCVSPDGERLVIRSGVVFETAGMTSVANLSNNINDGVWWNNRLVSIREIGGVTEVQTWDPVQFLQGAVVREIDGEPIRLFATSQGLLVITSVMGEPRFVLLNDELQTIYMSPARPRAPEDTMVVARSINSVGLEWRDASDNEEQFRVEYAELGSGGWTSGAVVPAGSSSATVGGLTPNTEYEFRVLAVLGELESEPSPVVATRTLSSVDEPVGEPYHLTLARVFSTSVTIEWRDNADNETGFRILRGTSASGPFTVFNVPANTESFTDDSVTRATSYYYYVQVVNGEIRGDLSDFLYVRTLWSDAAPSYYGSLQVVSLTPEAVEFTWNDTLPNEDGFIIERALSGTTDWVRVATTGYNAVSFTDTTVDPDTAYSYRLAAFNQWGTSSFRVTNVTVPGYGGEYLGLSERFGGVFYFAFKGPNRIERYDVAARQWLEPIVMSGVVTSLWVDESGVYVGEGRKLLRVAPDGSGLTTMTNASGDIDSLFTVGRVLVYTVGGRTHVAIDKATGEQLNTFEYTYRGRGHSVDQETGRVFFRSSNVSPSDINYMDIDQDGNLLAGRDSPYHGDFPAGVRTYLLPGGELVADNGGSIYTRDGLVYQRSYGLSLADADFSGDSPVVLRDDLLVTLSADRFLEVGRYRLGDDAGIRLMVDAGAAVVFSEDGSELNGLRVDVVPLSSIVPRETGPVVDPNGIRYTVDDAFVDRDGNVLLLSSGQSSLFTWSPSSLGYVDSRPLWGAPAHAAYSAQNHRAYFGYDESMLTELDLDGEGNEVVFANMPMDPHGLQTAGGFVMASDRSGAWNTHYVFSADGVLTDMQDWNRYSRAWTWDPVQRRMYFFRDGTSPNDLHYETLDAAGKITGKGETPYHSSSGIVPPIRVSQDGARVVLGSGRTFAADGLTELQWIDPFVDATWRSSDLIAIHDVSGSTVLTRWAGATLAKAGTMTFPGTPLRVLALPDDRVVLVTMEFNIPRIHLLAADLSSSVFFASTPVAVEDEPYEWDPNIEWSGLGQGPLTLTAPVLPGWLEFSNGRLIGVPREADAGTVLDPVASHRVVLRATNAVGQFTEREFFVQVQWVNDVPVLNGPVPVQVANELADPIRLDLAPLLADPDIDDSHSWEVKSVTRSDIFSSLVQGQDGVLEMAFAPMYYGESEVTVEVVDASGALAEVVVPVSLPAPPTSVEFGVELVLSRATGLFEQRVTVSNTGRRAVAGFELLISGLREGVVLYNGTTFGDGTARFVYGQAIGAGESVTVTLTYHATPRGDVPPPVIELVLLNPEPVVDAAMAEAPGGKLRVVGVTRHDGGGVAIDFETTPGTIYRVEYSSDLVDWTSCAVPIDAGGSEVRWIDRGPPLTESLPSSVPRRYYRIIEHNQ